MRLGHGVRAKREGARDGRCARKADSGVGVRPRGIGAWTALTCLSGILSRGERKRKCGFAMASERSVKEHATAAALGRRTIGPV
jgi:hypothetical protein